MAAVIDEFGKLSFSTARWLGVLPCQVARCGVLYCQVASCSVLPCQVARWLGVGSTVLSPPSHTLNRERGEGLHCTQLN